MASTKRATTVANKKTRKFNTLQELVTWLNSGKKVISLSTNSGVVIGMEVGLAPNINSYINGAYVYATIVNTNGAVNSYNWTLAQVGYYSPSTIQELQEELLEVEEIVKLIKAKLAYMKETGAEEFNENEFKVFNTLSILEEKKLSKLDKAKAIAALIENK